MSGVVCVAGQDSLPSRREERSGEPEERPGEKNQDVRIRFKTGTVRCLSSDVTHSHSRLAVNIQ